MLRGEREREKRGGNVFDRNRLCSLSLFFYLGSIETALSRRGAQSAAVDDDRPPRERREDAFEMVIGRRRKTTTKKTTRAGE